MKALIKKFEDKAPEVVFEWNDRETEAKGWVVINSLRGGAAGGGTRMRPGLDKREVESLAKTMEVKFTVSGPAIGGAKSGIDFDPKDPRKEAVLKRWYKAVIPLLKNYYGTGGDMNVDEIEEVIPITEEYGLWHPQEGIVNGHFNPNERNKINKIGQLRTGVSKVVEDPEFTPDGQKQYTIADLITGYGVAEAVKHYYNLWGGELKGKRVIVQGWGNVASAAALYLAKDGVKLVGVIDREGGLLSEEGLGLQEVKTLFANKNGNQLNTENMLSFDEVNERIWDMPADIFIPAAGSRLVTPEQVQRMSKAGVEVISCGANVPFKDQAIFYGPTYELADSTMAVIPDFIANAGMARVFAYLMGQDVALTDEAVFTDVSKTILEGLEQTRKHCKDNKNLASVSLKQAIGKLL
ncbi:Glu/Leu/Phe/Val dehydrogenase dimerization domain-containing protein [Limibacter armeniacum]|uniref:Glu/Leu/Phe/Val dehydrogenase dimerization domain-containing protein n=1 Tax=Limibacter armeniacum TaxID=466084 RepID=UPI002FE655B6